MSDQLAHFSHHHTLPVSPAWTRSPFSLSLNAQKHSTSPEQVSRLLLLYYDFIMWQTGYIRQTFQRSIRWLDSHSNRSMLSVKDSASLLERSLETFLRNIHICTSGSTFVNFCSKTVSREANRVFTLPISKPLLLFQLPVLVSNPCLPVFLAIVLVCVIFGAATKLSLKQKRFVDGFQPYVINWWYQIYDTQGRISQRGFCVLR